VLVSLVPLTLLGFALLGVLHRHDVWDEDLGPAIQERVRLPVYGGIDDTVQHIFQETAWPLLVFAALLTLWHVARGMRIVMKALNAIHGIDEDRSWRRLALTDLALALSLSGALTVAFLLVVLVPRAVESGWASTGLQVLAWVAATGLFALAVGVLVRYAPAERPDARWASVGSILVVVTWVVTTFGFAWWAGSVANYKSAIGVLAAFLVLTTYVLVSTTIFLAGALVDELARKRSR